MFVNKDIGNVNLQDKSVLEGLISKHYTFKHLIDNNIISKEQAVNLVEISINNKLCYNYGESKPQEYDNGDYQYVKIYELPNPQDINWKTQKKLLAEVRLYDSRIVINNKSGIDEKIIDFIKSGFSHPFNTRNGAGVTRWLFFSALWYFSFRGEPVGDYSD